MNSKTLLFETLWKEHRLRGALVKPVSDSDHLVICVPGFEGAATTAKKFTSLSLELAKRGVASLRLDFIGCGLSEGSYAETTVLDMALQLDKVRSFVQRQFTNISYVGHSLGACVIVKHLQMNSGAVVHRIGLLAPALNQRALLRYWFMQQKIKLSGTHQLVEWETRSDGFDEDEFLKDTQRVRETKLNRMQPEYFLENRDVDYRSLLPEDMRNILFVIGDDDHVVPLASFQTSAMNIAMVHGGDHENEKPSLLEQWLLLMTEHLCRQ